jgi:hypothetical protein
MCKNFKVLHNPALEYIGTKHTYPSMLLKYVLRTTNHENIASRSVNLIPCGSILAQNKKKEGECEKDCLSID